MKNIFGKLQKVILSLVVAVVTAGVVTIIASAGGPTIRTDANIAYYLGPQTAASGCSGTCQFVTQPGASEGNTIYYWKMGSVANIYDWCAYVPSAGQSGVKYSIYERSRAHSWTILLNQANNHGKYVYLGYSDYPNENDKTKLVDLTNACQSGFYCSGLKVYFDDIKYTTYPTRLDPTSCLVKP